jgi:hypothetical protein
MSGTMYQMDLYSAIRSPFAEVTPRLAPERVHVERISFAFGLEQIYAIIRHRRRHLHLPYTELDELVTILICRITYHA